MIIHAPLGKKYLPYQEAGIRYALGARGTIIADEMGLGKTVQAIGVANAMQAKRILIICPKSLKFNWWDELKAWLAYKPLFLEVVTYGEAECFKTSPIEWDLLIVDEAQYIKNARSKRSERVRHIAAKVKERVLLLTGTPIENCPVELWALLQVVCPEIWDPPIKERGMVRIPDVKTTHPGEGRNFWSYAERYCGLKKTSFPMGRGKFKTAWDFRGASNLDELNKRLRETCMVRRLKKDVLKDLPNKQRRLITLKSKTNDSFLLDKIGEVTDDNYFAVLKKLTSSKVLFEEYSKKRHEEALEKIDECIEIIEDALDSTNKIIVFAHHGDVIEKLYSAFETSNPGIAVRVTGKTALNDRGLRVKRFQEEPTCKLFIGSIGAAGVGITLTAASLVVFVELDPVPGRMNQAEDRAHRIGQKNMVLVWHLLSDGSICARIAKILVKKQEVITAALDNASAELVYKEEIG